MSAFRPATVRQSQIDYLTSDADLESAEGRLGVVLATRASQSSVDGLVATMGPAITAGTADKATAAQLTSAQAALDAAIASAGSLPGEMRMLQTVDGAAPAGWTKVGGVLARRDIGVARLIALPTRTGQANTPFSTALSSTTLTYHMLTMTPWGEVIVMYAFGSATVKSLYALNIHTMEWRQLASLPDTSGGGSLICIGDKLYCFYGNGTQSGGSAGNFLYVYSFTTDTWTKLQNHPTNSIHAVIAIPREDGKIFISGGATANNPAAVNWIPKQFVYDPAAGTYTALPDAPYYGVGRPLAQMAIPGTNYALATVWTSNGSSLTTNVTVLINMSTGAWEPPAEFSSIYGYNFHPAGASKVVLVRSGGYGTNESRGALFDLTQAAGSRLTSFDLGEPMSTTLGNFSRQGNYLGVRYNGYGVTWMSLSADYGLGLFDFGVAELSGHLAAIQVRKN